MSITSVASDDELAALEWLQERWGPYSVDFPPMQPMEVAVREGDYHAVAFILAMRRRSRLSQILTELEDYRQQHQQQQQLQQLGQQDQQQQYQQNSAQGSGAPTDGNASHLRRALDPEAALYARPGQWTHDKPQNHGQTYLHIACSSVLHDDPKVLWNMISILLHEGYNPMAQTSDGATPLHVLVQEQPQALDSIRLLIENGADVNHRTKKGLSVLHTLAHSYRPGCLEAMKLLVSYGADVKAISTHGWSVMHTFARYNSDPYDCIKYLIDHGVSVHSQTDEQCTVLHALARCIFKGEYTRESKDMFKTLKLVVEHGVDVNATTVKGWTALHYTAKDNPQPVEAMAYLLEHGANVNVIGADGWSVLHCLVRYNPTPLEGVKLLVKAGIDVNVLKAHHATALHSLAKHCTDPHELLESMRALLEAGVDVNARGKKDWTTLHYLVYSNGSPVESLKLLLENGARVNDKTADGWSPTHLLANTNTDPLQALKVLVAYGAEVNAVGKNGWSVLHSVARCTPKPLESIRFLLESGANPAVTTQDGWSVLHFLANYCSEPLESMRVLISKGAEVNAKTKSDWTSLHLVARANKDPYELFKLLLSYGADARAIGHRDWTVLHSLVRYNRAPYECIKLLIDHGADFRRKTGSDWTCMDLLTRYCPDPVPSIRLLLDKGAQLTSQSIFHVAEYNQDPCEALDLILSYKPEGAMELDTKGNTVMHIVVSRQKDPIPALEVLMRYGGNLNARGFMGRTPLHDAIERADHLLIADTLLDWMLAHGADPYMTFEEHGTSVHALLLAAKTGRESCVRILWEWMGDELTLKEVEMVRSEAISRRVREFFRKEIQKRKEMNCLDPLYLTSGFNEKLSLSSSSSSGAAAAAENSGPHSWSPSFMAHRSGSSVPASTFTVSAAAGEGGLTAGMHGGNTGFELQDGGAGRHMGTSLHVYPLSAGVPGPSDGHAPHMEHVTPHFFFADHRHAFGSPDLDMDVDADGRQLELSTTTTDVGLILLHASYMHHVCPSPAEESERTGNPERASTTVNGPGVGLYGGSTSSRAHVSLSELPEIWQELHRILAQISEAGLEPSQVEWVMYLFRLIRNSCANVPRNQDLARSHKVPEKVLEVVSQAANTHYGNQNYILMLRSGVQALSNMLTGNEKAQDHLCKLLLVQHPNPNFDQDLLSELLVSTSAEKKLLRQIMLASEATSGREEHQSFEMIFTLTDHLIDRGLFPQLFEALGPVPEDPEDIEEQSTNKSAKDSPLRSGLERMQNVKIEEVTDKEAANIENGGDGARHGQHLPYLSAEQVTLLKLLDSRVFMRHEKQHQQLAEDSSSESQPLLDLASVKELTHIFGKVSSQTIEILKALDKPGKGQHEVEDLANLSSGLLLLLACLSHLCLFDDGHVTTADLDDENEASQTQGTLIPIPDWFKAQHLAMVQAGIVENAIELLRQADVSLARVSKPVSPASADAASPALGANSNSTLLSDSSTIQGQQSFFEGMKRDIVRLIGNMAYRSRDVQDRVRDCNGLVVMLSQCNIDDANPYLREYAILAMKHLLTGNLESQKLINELQPIEAVDHPALQEARVQAKLDAQGRPVLSSKPAPPPQ
ncbi:hypothetical protein BGZ73_004593 [Actinomortierella ambigua]|nr:hypothetical protein BGZ73_004593 [Actinomortierella ambigua]